jgi:hypothetical protein
MAAPERQLVERDAGRHTAQEYSNDPAQPLSLAITGTHS